MTLDHEDIAAIAAEVARLLVPAKSAKAAQPVKVPLVLREAAEVCHVELVWLRERVARKEIAAYRSGAAGAWRVFPDDVKAFLMSETNIKPARRKSVLRMAV